MPSQTNEQALEVAIEKYLTGVSTEEIRNGVAEGQSLYGGLGYYIGNPNDYNARFAIDEVRFWDFLERTQPEQLEKLKRESDWKLKILDRLDKIIKKYGVLRNSEKRLIRR